MSTTTFRDNNLAVAGALAVVAAILAMIYAAHGGGNATAKAASSVGSSVYVAKRDIPVGTAASRLGADGYVTRKTLATSAVAPGAITDRRQLAGLVVVQPVYAGEQLTERRFGPSGNTGVLSELHGTARVIELAGDPRQLLAGTAKPGDHVDVLASIKSANGLSAVGRIVLRDLLLVDVSDSPKDSAAGATASTWVTLQLTDRQARTLFFLTKNGDWSLALRPFVRPADSPDTVVSTAGLTGGS